MYLAVFALLLSANASTPRAALVESFRQFQQLTGRRLECNDTLLSGAQCLQGAKRLLVAARLESMRGLGYETVMIDQSARATTGDGCAYVDFESSPTAMLKHLSQQTLSMKAVRIQLEDFRAQWGKQLVCVSSLQECSVGVKKLGRVFARNPNLKRHRFGRIQLSSSYNHSIMAGLGVDITDSVEGIGEFLRRVD